MYLFGQKDLLAAASPMWQKVLNVMVNDGLVGNSLGIYCQKHPNDVRQVKDDSEFLLSAPDGGCLLPCQVRLRECGHVCPRACHSDLPQHMGIFCPKPCHRLHPQCEHSCPKLCGEPCGKCLVKVADVVLPCGHTLENALCYQAKNLDKVQCLKRVTKAFRCGHSSIVACCTEICPERCSAILSCGHSCSAMCHDCWERTVEKGEKVESINDVTEHDIFCRKLCDRKLFCGHNCSSTCHLKGECPPCLNQCMVFLCEHSSCEHACKEMCHACAEQCIWDCPHGGPCELPCGAPCTKLPCDIRCTKILSCGHQCPSLCGEPCPDEKYCQVCASSAIKEQIVDMICFETYEQINLNETQVIILQCGHIKTVESLDGIMNLTDFYCRGSKGVWESVLPLNQKFVQVPVCPDCRTIIRHVRRYGRIITSAALDVAEKKFVIECGKTLSEFQIKLDALIELSQSNSDQVSTRLEELGIKWEGKKRLKREELLSGAVTRFLVEANDFLKFAFQSPARSVYEAILSHQYIVSGSKINISQIPSPASRFLGGGHMLISHSNLLLASLLLSKKEAKTKKSMNWIFSVLATGVVAAKHAYIVYQDSKNTCNAALAKFLELEFDQEFIKVFSSCPDSLRQVPSGFMSDFSSLTKEMDLSTELKACRTNLLEKKIPIVRSSVSAVDKLGETRISRMEAWLKDSIFYQEVSDLEISEIAIVMNNNDFHSSGHWYRCPNGHLYTIGECGGAMQISRCPECGASIGGLNHSLLSDNFQDTYAERNIH